MVYLGIVLLLLVIIAPIFSLLPSARQKQQMALRRMGMAEGIRVDLTQVEDPDPDPAAYVSNTGKPLPRIIKVAAYRLPRPRPNNWRDLPRCNWQIGRCKNASTGELPDGWVYLQPLHEATSEAMKDFLGRALPTLPDDVIVVEEETYVVSVYWREIGGEDALRQVLAFMKACVQVAPLDLNPLKDSRLDS
ncbi:MAG: hypothetical protein ACFHX7_05800 [Pseudomonadota bacterium]